VHVYRADGKSEIWLDGRLLSSTDLTVYHYIANTFDLVFGQEFPLDGELDDVRFYKRALSSAQIKALYREE
jgi:hypothetical protein